MKKMIVILVGMLLCLSAQAQVENSQFKMIEMPFYELYGMPCTEMFYTDVKGLDTGLCCNFNAPIITEYLKELNAGEIQHNRFSADERLLMQIALKEVSYEQLSDEGFIIDSTSVEGVYYYFKPFQMFQERGPLFMSDGKILR